VGKPPPRSQWDARSGSWDRRFVLLVLAVVAVLCGAAAYLKGLS